jgi:hypothetical protein
MYICSLPAGMVASMHSARLTKRDPQRLQANETGGDENVPKQS